MPRQTKTSSEFDPDACAVGWFGEMLIAADRGDYARAARAKSELDQLGWRVDRKTRTKAAGREAGR
jgi:hypothetical protein